MFSKIRVTGSSSPARKWRDLPEYARQLVHNYCVYDTGTTISSHGFKEMDGYLALSNHSKTSPIISVETVISPEASHDIAARKLFLDYMAKLFPRLISLLSFMLHHE